MHNIVTRTIEKTEGHPFLYMWVYCSGKHDKTIVLYQYADTRSGDIPKTFLKGYSGYLQTDGYAGYHALLKEHDGEVIPVGCFAHARRKFTDAKKALPKDMQSDPNTNIAKGIAYCDQIFRKEKELADLEPEEKKAARIEKLNPLLEQYFPWVKTLEGKVLKSNLQTALTYSINQGKTLRDFMLDPRLESSNNKAERFVKPFVIGRKNFLFCNTPSGAEASSVLYSLVETAKGNGLDPFKYFEYLFETLSQQPKITKVYLETLLPWSEPLPESCKAILDSSGNQNSDTK